MNTINAKEQEKIGYYTQLNKTSVVGGEAISNYGLNQMCAMQIH